MKPALVALGVWLTSSFAQADAAVSLQIAKWNLPPLEQQTAVSDTSPEVARMALQLLSGPIQTELSRFQAFPMQVTTINDTGDQFVLTVQVDISALYDDLTAKIDSLLKVDPTLKDYPESFEFDQEQTTPIQGTDTSVTPYILEYQVSFRSDLMTRQFLEAAKAPGGVLCEASLENLGLHIYDQPKSVWIHSSLGIDFPRCTLKITP